MVKTARGAASIAPLVVAFGTIMGAGGAQAANECGAPTYPNATITCNSSTYNGGGNILYDNADGIIINFDDPSFQLNIALPGSPSVFARSNGSTQNSVFIGGSFDQITSEQHGLLTWNRGISGDAVIEIDSGTIDVTQGYGLFAFVEANNAQGNAKTILGNGVVLNTAGPLQSSTGAIAFTMGRAGSADVEINGATIRIQGTGTGSYGALASAIDGNATVRMTDGLVETSPERSGALEAFIDDGGQGDARVIMRGGRVAATRSDGIYAQNVGLGRSVVEVYGGTVVGGDLGQAAVRTVANGGDKFSSLDPNSRITHSEIIIGTDAIIDGSASGIAIRDGDLLHWPVNSRPNGKDDFAGNVVVTSNGTVTGDAILGLGDDVFNLEGGSFEGDIYGDDRATAGMTVAEMVAFYANDGQSYINTAQDTFLSAQNEPGHTEAQLTGLDPSQRIGQDDTFNWSGGIFGGSFFGGNGSDAANITAATYDGTYHVLDGGDDYAVADGWRDILTLSGDASGDINGANVLNWERVNFDGVSVRIVDGALQVGADPDNGLFLLNGTVLDQSGADLVVTGNMANAASLRLQGGSVGDIVTVDGDYAGAMGVLLMDVNTATDTADRLTVTGASSGLTGITVNNLSPNTATGNDILLVSVTGASAESDFALIGGPLIAGAFQYGLEYQTGDFVLASALSSTGAAYEAAPHVLLDSIARMPTLEQRVGQRRWSSAAGSLEPTSGGWLRVSGDWFKADLNTGTSYDSDSWGLQAGFDLPVEPGENGQWVLGLTAQTSRVSGGIATATGTGELDAESLGFGLTGTWYGYDGTYVDLQGQVNWASVDYASSLSGVLAEDELARTAAASVEVGHRLELDANRALIPQAQLTWASADGGSFIDSAGNAVDMGSNDRLMGRLGLAYNYEWQDADSGSMQNVYVIGNILHDFDTAASVNVSGGSLASEREATWGEIGFGGSMTWNETTTLYGEASYREVFGSTGGSAFSAQAGLRLQW